jgi:hypothetical protein
VAGRLHHWPGALHPERDAIIRAGAAIANRSFIGLGLENLSNWMKSGLAIMH